MSHAVARSTGNYHPPGAEQGRSSPAQPPSCRQPLDGAERGSEGVRIAAAHGEMMRRRARASAPGLEMELATSGVCDDHLISSSSYIVRALSSLSSFPIHLSLSSSSCSLLLLLRHIHSLSVSSLCAAPRVNHQSLIHSFTHCPSRCCRKPSRIASTPSLLLYQPRCAIAVARPSSHRPADHLLNVVCALN